MHFWSYVRALISLSRESAFELLKSGLFFHYSFIVFLDIFLVSFQSLVFWGAHLSCEESKGWCAWCGAQIFHPSGLTSVSLESLQSMECCTLDVVFLSKTVSLPLLPILLWFLVTEALFIQCLNPLHCTAFHVMWFSTSASLSRVSIPFKGIIPYAVMDLLLCPWEGVSSEFSYAILNTPPEGYYLKFSF